MIVGVGTLGPDRLDEMCGHCELVEALCVNVNPVGENDPTEPHGQTPWLVIEGCRAWLDRSAHLQFAPVVHKLIDPVAKRSAG